MTSFYTPLTATHAPLFPSTCSDVPLCGHRTASKNQAGKTRQGKQAESSKRQPFFRTRQTARCLTHKHNLSPPCMQAAYKPHSPTSLVQLVQGCVSHPCMYRDKRWNEGCTQGTGVTLSQSYTQKLHGLLWNETSIYFFLIFF